MIIVVIIIVIRISVVCTLNIVMEVGTVPNWKNYPLRELNPSPGNVVDNFRSTACLSFIWKLLSGMLSEKEG